MMRIPKKGRPKWATHYMYQFEQVGEEGFWVGPDKIQGVNPDKSVQDVNEITEKTYKEYLQGMYHLTVQKLKPERLENK